MDKWTYFTDPDVRSWDKETRKRYEIVGSREEALNKGALLADKHRAKEFYITKIDPFVIPEINKETLEDSLYYLFQGREYDSHIGDRVLIEWLSDALKTKSSTEALTKYLNTAITDWARDTHNIPREDKYWYMGEVERVSLLPKIFLKTTEWDSNDVSYWKKYLESCLPMRLFAMVHGVDEETEQYEMQTADYLLYIITPSVSLKNHRLIYDIYEAMSKYPNKGLYIATLTTTPRYCHYELYEGLETKKHFVGKFPTFPDDEGYWKIFNWGFSPEEKEGIDRLKKATANLRRPHIIWFNTIEDVISFFVDYKEVNMYS